MNAITILATIVCLAVVVVPALGELGRIRDDQRNPMRRLRSATRRRKARHDAELTASSSCA